MQQKLQKSKKMKIILLVAKTGEFLRKNSDISIKVKFDKHLFT
tara:strand:- start:90 stop:218 length:129 start_codon:yes stop_codon:yes gene_type:complete